MSGDQSLFASPIEDLDARLESGLRALIEQGYTHFLCGMAEGFDLMAGEKINDLKREFPHLRLIAVVPFPEQAERFSAMVRERYDALMANTDEVVTIFPHYRPDCFHARNNFLVDNSSVLVCYYNGTRGGTEYTVRRAISQKIKVSNLS